MFVSVYGAKVGTIVMLVVTQFRKSVAPMANILIQGKYALNVT